jgi:penicillin-binding protein 1C
MITDMLADNSARSITFGPRSVLKLPFLAAVKTGTSTSYRDNWCLGYVPEFTVGVWVGNFEGEPMQGVSGVTGAGPIWRDVMLKLQARERLTWYVTPDSIERGRIDPRTGKRLNSAVPQTRHSRTDSWRKTQPPPPAQRSDYETSTGRAILGSQYTEWIQSPDNWLTDSVTADSHLRYQELRILQPTPGMVITHGDRLLLKATPANDIRWHCETLRQETDPTGTWLLLRPGKHRLSATRRGARAVVEFEVQAGGQ